MTTSMLPSAPRRPRGGRRPRGVAVLLVIAVVASIGIGTLVRMTRASHAMPAVVGVRLDTAHDRLEDVGITKFDDDDAFEDRSILLDMNWTVVAQDPPAGTALSSLDRVHLRVGKTHEPNTLHALGRPLPPAPVVRSSSPPPPEVSPIEAWFTASVAGRVAAVDDARFAMNGRTPPQCQAVQRAVTAARADLPTPDRDLTYELTRTYTEYEKGARICGQDYSWDEYDQTMAAGDVARDSARARLAELLPTPTPTPS